MPLSDTLQVRFGDKGNSGSVPGVRKSRVICQASEGLWLWDLGDRGSVMISGLVINVYI